MQKEIIKHINDVLKEKNYNEEYIQELIDACIVEYKQQLMQGLKKEDAFKIAIKDFDSEYNITLEKYDRPKRNFIFNLSIVFTLLTIFTFCLCHQVFSIDKFPWAVSIIIIPNIAILLVKMIIVFIKDYDKLKDELISFAISLTLYLPFIFIFIMGERDNLINYLITFQFDVIVLEVGYLIYKRKISLQSILLLCISILIFMSYFIMNNQNYILELITKYLILILIGISCIIDLFKNKANWKIIIISIGFAVFLNLIYFLFKYNIQIYDFYSIISILLILVLCLQFILKQQNNFTFKLFDLASVLLIIFSLNILVNSAFSMIKTGLHSNINFNFLISISIFLFLILFQKYVGDKKYDKEI